MFLYKSMSLPLQNKRKGRQLSVQRTERRLEIGISAVPGFLPKAEIRKKIMLQWNQAVLFT